MDVEPCEARSPPRHGSCYSRNPHRAVIYPRSALSQMYGIDRLVFALRRRLYSLLTSRPL